MWALQSADEVLDYHQNWELWMQTGDVLASSEWSITPWGVLNTGATPTLADQSLDVSTDMTSVFVSGLELGVSYQLKNTVTTIAGRTGVREITIRCANQ